MEWLKSIAPSLATAIAGPLGGLAASFIADKLGVDEKTVEAVSDALEGGKMDASQVTQIKLAEIEFKKFLEENEIKLEDIAAQDRKSAREREIATGDSLTPRILAGIVVCGYISVQWFLLEHVVAQEMREIVMRSLGVLDTALGLVLGYYFGTSASSRHKDETISMSVQAKAVQALR